MLVFSCRSYCCCSKLIGNSQDMTDMDSVQRSSERSNSQRQASERMCVCKGGQRLSTPEAPTSKVKVDFPNRHPRVSRQGTRVPASLPQKQRLLSNQIEDKQGVRAVRSGVLTSAWRSTQFHFHRSIEGFFIIYKCETESFIRS